MGVEQERREGGETDGDPTTPWLTEKTRKKSQSSMI